MPLALPTGIDLPYPKINGHELSRSSVDLVLDTLKIAGFTSINFKWSRAPGISFASRSKPQARTRGKITFTSDLTVYETTWDMIQKYLTNKGAPLGLGYSEVASAIVLSYSEPSLFDGVKTITIVGASVTEAEQGISDSDDQLMRKLTLSVMDILEDGVSPVTEHGLPGF